MMKVSYESGTTLNGVLRYIGSEHSFSFEPTDRSQLIERAGGPDVTSVAVGTLQLEFGVASKRALFVWGYHPRYAWTLESLSPPNAVPGTIVLSSDYELTPAASIRLAPVGAWRTSHDDSNGWVRVAEDGSTDDSAVEIANGVVIGVRDGGIHSVWLHPTGL
jgi:hypothetical protein